MPKVADPTFSIPSGTTFATSIIVDLSCSTKGATIKYSFDNEIWVTGKIVVITETTTLYAKATKDGMVDSDVVSATYISTAVATTTTTTTNQDVSTTLPSTTLGTSSTSLSTNSTSTTIVGSTTTTDTYVSTTLTTTASTSTSTTYVSTSTTTTVTTTTIAGKEINIKYNGINVEDGTTDLNIGETVYGTPKDLIFTIENQGNQNIILSGTPTKVSLTGDCFSLKTDANASIILPGKSTTFTVLFDHTYNTELDTEWSALISIANDDANENPYNFTIKGMGVINPEVSVEYNSSIINDEATDYPLTFPNGFTNDLKFTIKNIGVGNLLLTGSPRVTVSGSEFSLFQDAVGTISDGEYSEIIVKFSPAGSGTYTGSISIASNDDDNNPYNFSFKIVLTNYEPEINVKMNEINIADGSSNIDVGEILYDATKDITFIIENSGTSDLYLVGNPIINFSGTCFTLIKTIDNPLILPSKSASFTIRFTPNISSGSAEYIGTVSILNSDTDEDTYNWTIKGRSIINPEMNVKNGAVNIPDGTANYDFGSVKYGDPKDITFTVENNGIGDLLLTGSPRVALTGTGFSLKTDAASSIGQGSSATFTVTFTPPSSYGGNYSGTISISNNDGDESPYNFSIIAEGLMNPEINVKEGINAIDSGTVQYDIGSTMYGSPKDITFSIENSGLSLLVLSGTPRVTVTGTGFALKTDASANIAVGSSSNFIVTFNPTADGGDYTANIVISNNDIDESVYTSTIKGTGLIAPEINVKFGQLNIEDGSTDVYGGAYMLNEMSDIVFTIENTGIGNLRLTGSPKVSISGDFFTLKTDASSIIGQGSSSTFILTFNPLYEGEYTCNVSINNNDSNENVYTFSIICIDLKYTITFNKNDSNATGTMSNISIAPGSSVTLTANGFTKTNYTFAGWSSTSDGKVAYADTASYTMGTTNVTLYAVWYWTASLNLRDTGPAGGLIFYINPNYATDGYRYLECAPASTGWSSRVWGGYDVTLNGADETAIWTGEQNTFDIVKRFGNAEPYEYKTDYAAKLCSDLEFGGYDDWFLPSKDVLNLIYQNLYLKGVGGFSAAHWWSSTEYNINGAVYKVFSNEQQYNGAFKYEDKNVRAIRAY